MKVGVLSDIHGNKPALEAVLADMPPVDSIVCAGDVVGYYTWPGACVDALNERSVPTVMGNHDRAVAGGSSFRFHGAAHAGIRYAENDLNQAQFRWIKALPDDLVVFDGRMRIVHGHPLDPDRYTYPADVDDNILVNEPILIIGHTHVQFHERVNGGLVCNPGSVGQPRDGDPRAAYSIVDIERMTVDEHRVEYDIERTKRGVLENDLPYSLAERLESGR